MTDEEGIDGDEMSGSSINGFDVGLMPTGNFLTQSQSPCSQSNRMCR